MNYSLRHNPLSSRLFILRKYIGSSRPLVKGLLCVQGYGWPSGSDPVFRMNLPQTTSVFLSKGRCVEKNRIGEDSQEFKSGKAKLNTGPEGLKQEGGPWSLFLYQELPLWLHSNPTFFFICSPNQSTV